ncbi:hypothetical protein DSM19430T_03190 [Desulfovibrio psychrotolerans]|uniref:Uncharacterized protein n=1 Tax=Desulfovibrio psychrotolerans TaxID=415242 RepID=A0A7J0BR72_9BACT|nr:hypothetical protein DSM19430T_03190 [Desulfovibrio psychrotolerans]
MWRGAAVKGLEGFVSRSGLSEAVAIGRRTRYEDIAAWCALLHCRAFRFSVFPTTRAPDARTGVAFPGLWSRELPMYPGAPAWR